MLLTSKPFIVKVHTPGQVMYWTLNGSVVNREEAYVFTDKTMPDMFKSSLRAPYVGIEYV